MSLCSADGFPPSSLQFHQRDEAGFSAAAVQRGASKRSVFTKSATGNLFPRQKSPCWSEAEQQRRANTMRSHEPIMLFANKIPLGELLECHVHTRTDLKGPVCVCVGGGGVCVLDTP